MSITYRVHHEANGTKRVVWIRNGATVLELRLPGNTHHAEQLADSLHEMFHEGVEAALHPDPDPNPEQA